MYSNQWILKYLGIYNKKHFTRDNLENLTDGRTVPQIIIDVKPIGGYDCDVFRGLLKTFKTIQSMSGKGNGYDNAVAKSFFHTLNTELIKLRGKK